MGRRGRWLGAGQGFRGLEVMLCAVFDPEVGGIEGAVAGSGEGLVRGEGRGGEMLRLMR
jgi:hypothetical protein